MKDSFIILDGFNPGWQVREDETRIPLGAAQLAQNITITDRRGISPRTAETLVGSANSALYGVKSATSFRKSGTSSPILVKTYADKIEYYNNVSDGWCLLEDGYTSGKRFGFKHMRVADDPFDWLYFGNGVDEYSRWCGYESKITSALAGGETTVPVSTTLWPEVYYTDTASSVTTTTITMPAGTWATDIWNNFYVRITSGAQTGKIALISATTATQITFATITGLSGTPTFEIRLLAVPATGTLVYGTTKLAYSAVPTDASFTTSSATATAINTGVTVRPTTYNGNPRANIFETMDEAMYVAGVMNKPNTVFRSRIADATNFTYSGTRAANEGDVVYFPYGGSGISDIKRKEQVLYVFKPESIDSLKYSQDAVDLSVIDSIKAGVTAGTKSLTWYMDDDIAFVTPDNRITTLGRVALKDSTPQTTDIAYPIRRETKKYDFGSSFGEEYVNQGFLACKSSPTNASNDRVIVWNKDYKAWESYWNISASCFVAHNGYFYYGDANTPDMYRMFAETNKTKGTTTFPMTSRWKSGFINGKGNAFHLNEISCLASEGYIKANSTIDFKLYKDFSSTPFQSLQLVASEDTNNLDEETTFTLMGGDPLGLEPLGAGSIIGDEDADGRRHFVVYLYFQATQVEYVAVEVSSSGLGQVWEITRLGLNAAENVFEAQSRIKN